MVCSVFPDWRQCARMCSDVMWSYHRGCVARRGCEVHCLLSANAPGSDGTFWSWLMLSSAGALLGVGGRPVGSFQHTASQEVASGMSILAQRRFEKEM